MGNYATKNFLGKVIQVDRNGPESKIGKLLHTADDYIAVLTEDEGVVCYNSHHIKSFTVNLNKEMELNVKIPKDLKFEADNLKELLKSLNYKWVQINRGGPETVEGVLVGLEDDFINLIVGDEVVRITIFHIKNVSYGPKIEKAKAKDHESRNHESREDESLEHESLEHESREDESREDESREDESQEDESLEHESRPESSDESENKNNSRTEVNRYNFEGELSFLLASIEKFLRNHSKN
jgi:small nuclear ribonucleoprotein (snRNP)-like protein